MDSFLPYLLLSLLLPLLSLYVVSIGRRKGSGNPKNLPPGSTGTWPILGEHREYSLDPQKFVKDRMQKHSAEIFQTSLFGEKVVVFCGAQGNKFMFMNDGKLFATWFPQSVKNALQLNYTKKKISHIRRTHLDILKPDDLKKYVVVMDALARQQMVTDWKPNSVVKIVAWSKKYPFDLFCKLFLGMDDPVCIKKLFDPFTAMMDQAYCVPVNLPGTAYSRAAKSGKVLREEMVKIIEERRKELVSMEDKEEDLLTKMLVMEDENGKCFTDVEICDYFVGLLAAGGTTGPALTAVFNYLAQLPHIYNGVFQEQMEIARSKGPDETLAWGDFEKMKYSWNVARESMRLMNPAQGALKETTTEFTYAGFTIPKGIKAFWTVYSTNMNPEYFPEPEKFDPSRFEGAGPPAYAYVPFGGGPRMCGGRDFARLILLVCMHNAVTRFKLEKAIPDEKIVFNDKANPVHGLPIRIRPHEK